MESPPARKIELGPRNSAAGFQDTLFGRVEIVSAHDRHGGGHPFGTGVNAPIDPGALDAELSAIAAGLDFGNVTQRSRRFAELLGQATQSSIAERYGEARDHGVRTAAFYVLVGAEMPALLFETAFISNPDDEARLATADYRQKLADAIVNAVRAYRDGL